MKSEFELSTTKRKALMAGVEKRRNIMAKHVRSVAQGYTTALFIYGPGGLGKTHGVVAELNALCGKGWCHHTAFTTPKALMLSLMEAPDAVHLFEDCESMYKAQVSAEILRAACGAPKDAVRRVTYQTAHEQLTCHFRGGIIIVSNESLKTTKGPLQAVASRFKPWRWDLTLQERVAVVLDLADQGWDRGGRKLTPAECRKVAAFLIEEMSTEGNGGQLDLRLFVEHACPAYAQYLDDPSGASWKDVLRSKLVGQVELPENRAAKTLALENLAYQISQDAGLKTSKDRVLKWTSETGLGMVIYYRHLQNAKKKRQISGPRFEKGKPFKPENN